MAYSELRQNDMRVEREIARFTDSRIYTLPFFQNVRRTDSLEWQFKGSDIIFDFPSRGIQNAIVDEKCQAHYFLNPLPTFALELSFLNKNDSLTQGWFIDENKLTQYYNFLWITASVDKETFTADKVVGCDFALVSRQRLLDFLSSEGLSKEKLTEKDIIIRNSYPQGGAIDKRSDKPYWFYFTPKLREQPINIVFRKNKLFELSECYHKDF